MEKDPHHVEEILHSFKLKKYEKIKTEKPQETIAERVKLK